VVELGNDQLTTKLEFAEELLTIVETLDGEKCRWENFECAEYFTEY